MLIFMYLKNTHFGYSHSQLKKLEKEKKVNFEQLLGIANYSELNALQNSLLTDTVPKLCLN